MKKIFIKINVFQNNDLVSQYELLYQKEWLTYHKIMTYYKIMTLYFILKNDAVSQNTVKWYDNYFILNYYFEKVSL